MKGNRLTTDFNEMLKMPLYRTLQYFPLQDFELVYTTDNFKLLFKMGNCNLRFRPILTERLNELHKNNLINLSNENVVWF